MRWAKCPNPPWRFHSNYAIKLIATRSRWAAFRQNSRESPLMHTLWIVSAAKPLNKFRGAKLALSPSLSGHFCSFPCACEGVYFGKSYKCRGTRDRFVQEEAGRGRIYRGGYWNFAFNVMDARACGCNEKAKGTYRIYPQEICAS